MQPSLPLRLLLAVVVCAITLAAVTLWLFRCSFRYLAGRDKAA